MHTHVPLEEALPSCRSGARGGLEGAIALPSEHASPPSVGEKRFFGDFWHFLLL